MDEKKAVADLEAILSTSLSECELVDLLKQAISLESDEEKRARSTDGSDEENERERTEYEYECEDRYIDLISSTIMRTNDESDFFGCSSLTTGGYHDTNFKILDKKLCRKFEYELSIYVVNVVYNRYKRNLKRCYPNKLFNFALMRLAHFLSIGHGCVPQKDISFHDIINYDCL